MVTGIRASIESSAAQKRTASGILDAISSEDLGKFPDANVAESLQRIPGVAIDRSNGEGQSVTVRGLGPAFNTVLFNGRSFASDNYGRSFSFDLIPAELISGAQVYKSAQAPLQGGGIGATINIQTPRPLALKESKGIVTGKALYEKNSDKFTPQGFALLSDTFGDGRLGLLGSVSYQRRIAQVAGISNDGFMRNQTIGSTANGQAPLATGVYAPRNQNVGTTRDDRTRLGATLVAQYAPTDELTFTVDGLYNKFKSDSTTRSLGSWFEPSSYTAVGVDANKTVTSLTTNGNADFIASGALRETTTWEGGFNAERNPSETVKMIFDATWSRAKNAGGGGSYFTVIGVPTTYSYAAAEGNGISSTTGYGTNQAALTDPSLGRTHIAGVSGNDITETVKEFRWNTEWKPGWEPVQAIRFGVMRTSRDKSNVPVTSDPDVGCLYCGYPTLADPSLLTPFTVRGLGQSGGSVPTTFLTYDPRAYLNFLTSAAATTALDLSQGRAPGTTAAIYARTNGYAATRQPSSRVTEVVYASYADVDFGGDFGNEMSWFVNVGARYEYTELSSFGQQRLLTDLLPVRTDPTIWTGTFATTAGEPVTRDASYNNFLPALNARLNFSSNLQARFAAYKTLTRPAISDLAPTLNYDTLRPATQSASGGNPALKPYKASNLDLSLEWYPTRATTLSAAVFYKKIDDFIVQRFENEIFQIINAGGVSTPLISGTNATFSVRRPRNAESLEVRGLELNVVHTLDWLPGVLSGFGVQANATFVKTNQPFDVTSFDQSFAAEGIGNSQNATLFYEKYGVSARIAYNRRERFLRQLAGGPGNEPIFVRDYGQFDGSVAVNVTPAVQVFVEGTNLFNAKYFQTGRFDNQLLQYQNFGPRYDAGVRFSF